MVDSIQGDGENPSISSRQQRKMYEAEYKQAADLFQRTLKEYEKSDNRFQKEEFKKVMDESLQVLKDSASELKRQDLLNRNSEIEKDFVAFQNDDTKDTKLKTDLDKAKKSV